MSGIPSENDLFNNPAMKKQFESLPKEEQEAYKKAGEYMYEKDYTSETTAIDDAVRYIKNAFDAGMMPYQLTEEELVFLRNLYGADWYTNFGFPSENYTGLEKKTTKRKQRPIIRPEPIKMPVIPLKTNVVSVEDVIEEDEDVIEEDDFIEETTDHTHDEESEKDPEELEVNRQISWMYTVWS